MSRVIVPLDVGSTRAALGIVDRLGDDVEVYKVGFELYTSVGPSLVRELVARGKRIFLDIKLHDIPNTVAGAVAAASDLGVEFLTVHASGGETMLRAAADARAGELKLLGVTVLTSLSPDELSAVWNREIRSIREDVGRLALLARDAKMDGVVASPLEASWIRSRVGRDFLIVTPGVRPAGSDRGDQSRVATPRQAIAAGADYLVIGRPITGAEDPVAALRAIEHEIENAEDHA